MTYQITLEQLDKLSLLICEMDGKNHPKSNLKNAGKAHEIISEVLGNDEHMLYASADENFHSEA